MIIKMRFIKAAQVGDISSYILHKYLCDMLTLSLLKCQFQLYH